ncbi:MAG: hypothetical protein ACRD03_06765 [Acidimicrobiales bacterium]
MKAMRAAGGLVARLPAAAFKPVLAGFLRLGHDRSDVAAESMARHFVPEDHPEPVATAVAEVLAARRFHASSVRPRRRVRRRGRQDRLALPRPAPRRSDRPCRQRRRPGKVQGERVRGRAKEE